ncbi:hypothetical protein Q7Q91_16180 [Lactiplantibacillus pentosus]|uniref:hypothetical protein n=1 Tax=Lactiplantibacillus pentosus TaxID=1589 RepID=UPI00271023D1|nr:hypothetical protein [Lactiplantibacillus pentosus]MDO7806526.1 hypothetical protein [Lactiplantibacillus pentosus]
MININIDSDDEGKIRLAVQGHVIPSWVYENSQVEHENKRVRLMRQHQRMLEREAQQERERRRKRERVRQQQRQKQLDVNSMKPSQGYNLNNTIIHKKEKIDDGPDF